MNTAPDTSDNLSLVSSSTQIHRIRLDLIDATGRLRPIDPAKVQVIKDSILSYRINSGDENGIPAPITLRPGENGRFKLVAGAHRLGAVAELGDNAIDALIRTMNDQQARLMEIDENLCRAELSAFDRASFLAERDRVWKEIHPELGKGKAGAKARWHHASDTMSFASDVSDRVGLSNRSIQREVKLFRALAETPEVIARIRGSWLEDHQGQLMALAKAGPDLRGQVLDRLLRDEKPVANVSAALAEIEGRRESAADPDEKSFAALVSDWTRASAKSRSRFLDHLHSTGALDAYVNGPEEEEEKAA